MGKVRRDALKQGYRSGFELEVAKELETRGVRFEYESVNCKFGYFKPIRNGVLVDKNWKVVKVDGRVCQRCFYTVDFYLPDHNFWIETKGRFVSSDRTKHKLIRDQYPEGLDLRILFQHNGKATPKLSYTQWCDKEGITYGVIRKKTKKQEAQYLPNKWYEELNSDA